MKKLIISSFSDQKKNCLRFYASSLKKDVENVSTKKTFSNSLKSTSPESRKVESEIKDPKPLSQSSGESFNGNGKKKNNIVLYLSPIIAAALLYQVVKCFNCCFPRLLGRQYFIYFFIRENSVVGLMLSTQFCIYAVVVRVLYCHCFLKELYYILL